MVAAIVAALAIPWAVPLSFAVPTPGWHVGRSGTVYTKVMQQREPLSVAWAANVKYRDVATVIHRIEPLDISRAPGLSYGQRFSLLPIGRQTVVERVSAIHSPTLIGSLAAREPVWRVASGSSTGGDRIGRTAFSFGSTSGQGQRER